MAVRKRLVMRFIDSNERIVSFTINPPAEPVNLADVDELMDLIIASNTFYTYTGGAIVEKVDVRMYTEQIEPITEF
jgi:hypothetical protein